MDLLQGAGAAVAVLDVHLLERVGGDLLELLVAGPLLLGVEEARGVAGRQGDGQVPDAVLVRRPDRPRSLRACSIGAGWSSAAASGSGNAWRLSARIALICRSAASAIDGSTGRAGVTAWCAAIARR